MTALLIGLYVAAGLLVAADMLALARREGVTMDTDACIAVLVLGALVGLPLLVYRELRWRL